MLVCALYPRPQLLVAVEPNEGVAHAISVLEMADLTSEPGLDFVHELVVCYPRMYADSDQVVCNAVEDLDLHERSLRIGGRNGRGVDVGNGARARSRRNGVGAERR